MGTLTRNGLITVFRNHLQELRKLIPQIITHQKNPNNSLIQYINVKEIHYVNRRNIVDDDTF